MHKSRVPKRLGSPLHRELSRAEALMRAQRFGEAEIAFRAVLDRFPEHWAALSGLGRLALQANNPTASVELLGRALTKRRSDPALLNNFANALIAANHPDEAIKSLEKALKLQPRFPEALCNLARALRQLGRGEEAVSAYNRCLAITPSLAMAQLGRARALLELGRAAEATASLRGILASDPDFPGAYAILAQATKFTHEDPEPAVVERLLNQPNLPLNDRIRLTYAAAKMADDLGDYDRAISRLKEANRMRSTDFDPDTYSKRVDAIQKVFSRDFFAERADWGDPSPLPIFIVGMPRSALP